MSKLNIYNKLILILYGICFIYLALIHVPFKLKDNAQIVYDYLFSDRANIDLSRLLINLIVCTIIFSLLFVLAYSFRLKIAIRGIEKRRLLKRVLLVVGVIGVALSAIIFYKSSSSHNTQDMSAIPPIDNNTRPYEAPKYFKEEPIKEPEYYRLYISRFFTDKKFQEFVSFVIINLYEEPITNIMLLEVDRHKGKNKEKFTNKPVNILPGDSAKFTFKLDHDGSYIYKLRFKSGKAVDIYNDDNSPFLEPEGTIYDKNGFDWYFRNKKGSLKK